MQNAKRSQRAREQMLLNCGWMVVALRYLYIHGIILTLSHESKFPQVNLSNVYSWRERAGLGMADCHSNIPLTNTFTYFIACYF